jgi:hypothetical protein
MSIRITLSPRSSSRGAETTAMNAYRVWCVFMLFCVVQASGLTVGRWPCELSSDSRSLGLGLLCGIRGHTLLNKAKSTDCYPRSAAWTLSAASSP